MPYSDELQPDDIYNIMSYLGHNVEKELAPHSQSLNEIIHTPFDCDALLEHRFSSSILPDNLREYDLIIFGENHFDCIMTSEQLAELTHIKPESIVHEGFSVYQYDSKHGLSKSSTEPLTQVDRELLDINTKNSFWVRKGAFLHFADKHNTQMLGCDISRSQSFKIFEEVAQSKFPGQNIQVDRLYYLKPYIADALLDGADVVRHEKMENDILKAHGAVSGPLPVILGNYHANYFQQQGIFEEQGLNCLYLNQVSKQISGPGFNYDYLQKDFDHWLSKHFSNDADAFKRDHTAFIRNIISEGKLTEDKLLSMPINAAFQFLTGVGQNFAEYHLPANHFSALLTLANYYGKYPASSYTNVRVIE